MGALHYTRWIHTLVAYSLLKTADGDLLGRELFTRLGRAKSVNDSFSGPLPHISEINIKFHA